MNPPRIVFNWLDAKNGRYICIAENNKTENTEDNTKDVPLDTAEKESNFNVKHLFGM